MVAIFGVIIPLWQTNKQESKVDAAISEMKNNFDKLSNLQLLRPNLDCQYNGKSIDRLILAFDSSETKKTLTVVNTGDARAVNIELEIYSDAWIAPEIFSSLEIKDVGPLSDFNFKSGFRAYLDPLAPKQSTAFCIIKEPLVKGQSSITMKLFYDDSSGPKIFSFVLKNGSNE
ncbi:MAG: hypothetical protein NTW14_04120 [bacterium]|nr:hypothetical protein [bacterium]